MAITILTDKTGWKDICSSVSVINEITTRDVIRQITIIPSRRGARTCARSIPKVVLRFVTASSSRISLAAEVIARIIYRRVPAAAVAALHRNNTATRRTFQLSSRPNATEKLNGTLDREGSERKEREKKGGRWNGSFNLLNYPYELVLNQRY